VARRRILVVDDDQAVLRLVELSLSRAGYEVITAATGEEGVRKVQAQAPDLVLMDVMMPGIDGFEATRRIRRSPEGRHIPIIFLSSLDKMEAKVKGLRIGGDDYITKPVKIGELVARVKVRLRPEALGLGQLVTVFGSKAGVGTTTLTVNLALALHNVSQKSVLLVDWQRPLGNVALFLGLPKKRVLEILLPFVNDLDEQVFTTALKEYLPGVWVLLGVSDPAFARQMNREALDNILEMALAKADYVLVDGGPFLSWEDPLLTEKGEGLSLCVLTPELISVEQAAHAMETVRAMNCDFWLLLNRHGMPGGVPRKQIESRLGTVLRGCVPDGSDRVIRALNEGQPLYLTDPGSDFSRAIGDIANRIHEALAV